MDMQPAAGQLWRDQDGAARICGIVAVEDVPYAVLLRTRGATGKRKRRPFLFPVASLLAGDDGWHHEPEIHPEAGTVDVDREPTANETAGITWWNSLPETMRLYWCELAGSYVAADAWAHFKRARPEEVAAWRAAASP